MLTEWIRSFGKKSPVFATLLLLLLLLLLMPPAALRAVEAPLVELQAAALAEGALSNWTNTGSLGGSLTASLRPGLAVGTVSGRAAVTFDGTRYLRSSNPAPATLGGSHAFSIAVWGYNPAVAANENIVSWSDRALSPGEGGYGAFGWGTNQGEGAAYYRYGLDLPYNAASVPSANAWHHIAFTFAGGAGAAMKVYVDGVLNNAVTLTDTMNGQSGKPILLGGLWWGAHSPEFFNPFTGSLARVNVYDFELAAGEVSHLAGLAGTAPAAPLVDLDAASIAGTTVDSWPNAGTLGGSFDVDSTRPRVATVSGRKAVEFAGSQWMTSGFTLPTSLTGNSDLTVVATLCNPAIGDKETYAALAARPENWAEYNYGSKGAGAYAGGTAGDIPFRVAPPAGQWQQIACVYAGGNPGAFQIYVNGEPDARSTVTLNTAAGGNLRVGAGTLAPAGDAVTPFTGAVQDLRIYGSALPEVQVRNLAGLVRCYNPVPADQSMTDTLQILLRWQAGSEETASFDVFFGTDRAAVEAATNAPPVGTPANAVVFKGNQPAADGDYGPIPLSMGQTCYWRIDQRNAAGNLVAAGTVWTFTADSGIARNPTPADAQTVDLRTFDRLLAWTPGSFAVTQELYFGDNLEAVRDATTPTSAGLSAQARTFSCGDLLYERTYYWRVDSRNGALPLSKGTVWSFKVAPQAIWNDITFFIATDPHYGLSAQTNADNATAVGVMNGFAGTPYPDALGGGKVAIPRGVVVTGDLTEDNQTAHWDAFRLDYGIDGEGRLKFPVFEGYGNHDRHGDRPVVNEGIKARNLLRPNLANISSNGYHYSWDWDEVHLVQLNLYAGGTGNAAYSIDFLRADLLQQVGPSGRPVVILQHYGFDPGFGLTSWSLAEQDALYEVVKDYNVIAFFGGHAHNAQQGVWRGFNWFLTPASQPWGATRGFNVIHITPQKMTVAVRSGDGSWGLSHQAPIAFPSPALAQNPLPQDRSGSVALDTAQLRWTPGIGALSQNLYFGTSINEVADGTTPAVAGLSGDATAVPMPRAPLPPGSTLFWRVDTVMAGDTVVRGNVWRFTTVGSMGYNDVTFYVVSDTHAGLNAGVDATYPTTVDRMNSVPGTAYPPLVSPGFVQPARGVLHCGDMTDGGTATQWNQFLANYGMDGNARLAYPVYECFGNHDGPETGLVRQGIRTRNLTRSPQIFTDGLHYSWDWDGVHFVNIGISPGGTYTPYNPERSLDFLTSDLSLHVGASGRPVVLYQHFGYDAYGATWWPQADRDACYAAIRNYNVVGIFHGHSHDCTIYKWNGIDVFNAPHSDRDPPYGHGFFAVRITPDKMTVMERLNDNAWGKTFEKEIRFSPDDYTITASAATGGVIAPSGPVTVRGGASQTFHFTPAPGQVVREVRVDGVSVGAPPSYTFVNLSANHSVEVTFQRRQARVLWWQLQD